MGVLIKYLIYLSYLFFFSELGLMLVKRSGTKSSKVQKDKGSLVLLWITIAISFTLGFIFANYHHWGYSEYLVYGIGLFIILIGLIIRWISIFQLKKAFTVDVAIGAEHKLKTDGMYKVIRHPSYLGLLLIMVGFSICMNSLISAIIVTVLMFLVILYRIVVEERVLIEGFGDAYKTYQLRTKRLIPWIY